MRNGNLELVALLAERVMTTVNWTWNEALVGRLDGEIYTATDSLLDRKHHQRYHT